MKKLLILVLFICQSAYAGFYDSDYFEATSLCVIAGSATYLSNQDGDDIVVESALACGVGALVGYSMTKYFKKKVVNRHQIELEDLKIQNQKFEDELMQHAIRGDTDVNYGVISEEPVKGSNLKGRGVMSPTKIIKISRYLQEKGEFHLYYAEVYGLQSPLVPYCHHNESQ